ncbi:hypothetical protein GCM10020295_33970 [Streptomyces cinereospinus]
MGLADALFYGSAHRGHASSLTPAEGFRTRLRSLAPPVHDRPLQDGEAARHGSLLETRGQVLDGHRPLAEELLGVLVENQLDPLPPSIRATATPWRPAASTASSTTKTPGILAAAR